MKDVEKETTDDEGARFSVSYRVNYSGEVHNVSGLETLEDCVGQGSLASKVLLCARTKRPGLCSENESDADGERALDVQGIGYSMQT